MKPLSKGKTGYGLLIEYDAGFISPSDNTHFLREMKEGSEKGIVRTKLYGVMQKYGVENKNGRIYPEALLKREADNYMKLVEMGASAGHTDHPDCYSEGAEILTTEGWKFFKDLKGNESVYTLKLDGSISVEKINKKIVQPYKGKMIRLKGLNIDCEVTPNHKFPVYDRKRNQKFITAQEIFDGTITDMSKHFIPKRARNFELGKNGVFTISKIKNFHSRVSKVFYKKQFKDLVLDEVLFASFMGIYLAEGCCSTSKNSYKISIYQNKLDNVEKIDNLLKSLNFHYHKRERKIGGFVFEIIDARLYNFLKPLGVAKNKYIPEEIKNMSFEALNALFEWFHLGDGRIRNGKQKSIFSTSKRLMEDFQEVLLKIGKSGNITIDKRTEKDRLINENGNVRVIKACNSNDIYNLNISNCNGIFLNKDFLNVEEFDYEGNVYCVNVPNHTFFARQNGKTHWSGNSAIISIKEVSMRVTNLWWEGRNLMGEIYLPITKGYIETGVISHPADKVAHDIMHGFQYGVSSRGVGSLESKGGKNIVQDDFELICWDFVTTPSTNGSWVFSDKSKAEPFKESLDVKGYDVEADFNKHKKNGDMWDYMLKGRSPQKVDKINNVFNSFLDKF
jgi:hypothetical protein